MIVGLSLAAGYAATLFVAKKKEKRYDRRIFQAGAFKTNIGKDALVKFAQSSGMRFIVAGALGVLAFWSEQDWGAWAPVVAYLIGTAIDYINSNDYLEEKM